MFVKILSSSESPPWDLTWLTITTAPVVGVKREDGAEAIDDTARRLAPEADCFAGDPRGSAPPSVPPKQGDSIFEKMRGAWHTAIVMGTNDHKDMQIGINRSEFFRD